MGKITIKKISKELESKAQPDKKTIRSSLSDEHIGEFYNIPIEKVVPYKKQSRTSFDHEDLENLSKTIKKHGIRQPLTVLLNEKDQYEVVSGERRLRAAKLIGLSRVPCIVLKDAKHAEELSIIENLQRKDLHPVELSNALKSLLDVGHTQKDITEKLSLRKSFVSEMLKISDLDDEVQKFLLENKITSRRVLRDVVSGKQRISDLQKQIVSEAKTQYKRSKPIFRVGIVDGECVVQKGILSKLTQDQKKSLKKELNLIVKEYLS